MKKYIIILISLVVFSCKNNNQKTDAKTVEIDSTYIAKKIAYFSVNNYNIEGEGKRMIEKIINESQFIVFGENHYSKQTSILTKALINKASKEGFTEFIAEVGPNSAKKILELSSPYQATVENLKEFNTKYKYKELGETADPIPFFAGVEDAEFLQEIRKNKMNFHGIDQEYFYAILFFTDELLKEATNKSNYTKIKILKEKVDKVVYQYLKDNEEGKIKNPIEAFEKDKDINAFFNQFTNEDTKANKIIKDLKFSWDIYVRWRSGSHYDRISYMRNNLLEIYNKANKPKMFIKIGSLHASKILSNSSYDIGFFTEELAKENNSISTSINSWRPFYKEKDSIVNSLKKYKNYYNKYRLFTEFIKENKWGIIDLRSIREDIELKKIKLPTNGDYHHLKSLIDGYDYQLIIPVDEEITYNFKK